MTVQRPNPDAHAAELHHLFAQTFSDYWVWHDFATRGYFVGAPYDWSASRVVLIDGQIACHFGVWDFTMRIGGAEVRVAAIGAVATRRDLRKKGMMRQVVEEAVNSFADEGYDMSLLFGISNYYGKHGYVTTFVEGRFSVNPRELDSIDPPVHYQPFEGDIPSLAEQYNRENRGITGTYVRPTYTGNRRAAKFSIYKFNGGYVVAGRDGDALQIADLAGPPEQVLDVCRSLAYEQLTATIEFVFLPRRSAMGEFLQTISHRYTAKFTREGGPMARVCNLNSIVGKLCPVLGERLKTAGLSSYVGTLLLHGDDDSVLLHISDGLVRLPADQTSEAAKPQTAGTVHAGPSLIRLLIGDDDPGRICRQAGITLEGDATFLVPALFPDQEPSTVLWDRF